MRPRSRVYPGILGQVGALLLVPSGAEIHKSGRPVASNWGFCCWGFYVLVGLQDYSPGITSSGPLAYLIALRALGGSKLPVKGVRVACVPGTSFVLTRGLEVALYVKFEMAPRRRSAGVLFSLRCSWRWSEMNGCRIWCLLVLAVPLLALVSFDDKKRRRSSRG